jgi:serine/threonine protein kinase
MQASGSAGRSALSRCRSEGFLDLGDYEVRGEETGCVWTVHIARQISAPGSGERRKGESEECGDVVIHTLRKEKMYEQDIVLARDSLAIARLPAVRACPFIRQLVDTCETESELSVIWEWADLTLRDAIESHEIGPDTRRDVAENVGAALETLHAAGYVHADIAPNNILRVRGTWKLGDLDNCCEVGTPLTRFPQERYRHPKAVAGAPADPTFDDFGLEQILKRLSELGT